MFDAFEQVQKILRIKTKCHYTRYTTCKKTRVKSDNTSDVRYKHTVNQIQSLKYNKVMAGDKISQYVQSGAVHVR